MGRRRRKKNEAKELWSTPVAGLETRIKKLILDILVIWNMYRRFGFFGGDLRSDPPKAEGIFKTPRAAREGPRARGLPEGFWKSPTGWGGSGEDPRQKTRILCLFFCMKKFLKKFVEKIFENFCRKNFWKIFVQKFLSKKFLSKKFLPKKFLSKKLLSKKFLSKKFFRQKIFVEKIFDEKNCRLSNYRVIWNRLRVIWNHP